MDSGTPHHPPRSLASIVRADARLLILAVLTGLALAIAYINVAERRYLVSFVLVPTQASGAAEKLLGGSLGSLASFAGVDLPGGGDSLNFDLLPDAMVSRETATTLANDPAILRATFPRLWDNASGRWKEPDGAVYNIIKAVRSAASVVLGTDGPKFKPPGPQDMQEFLSKRVTVSRDRKRPVITVSILHADPAYAKTLLYRAWLSSDQRMKMSALTRSKANIAYLSRRLNQTQALDYRLYLFTVMSQEEKRQMTTSSPLPYVAEPFGAPVASVKPVSPDILFTLLTFPLVALIIGIAVMVVRRRDELARLLTARQSDPL
ncbi:MAG: hypothetical protein CFE37_04825 [Alphaproteobacteria bacterium PA4]|nr:MAG: hypothetical protein CFE37_04825 [Alphaproteobacteria bacterium PA4]